MIPACDPHQTVLLLLVVKRGQIELFVALIGTLLDSRQSAALAALGGALLATLLERGLAPFVLLRLRRDRHQHAVTTAINPRDFLTVGRPRLALSRREIQLQLLLFRGEQ